MDVMEKKIQVLLVEDNPGDARLVDIMLQDDYPNQVIIIHAESLKSALLELDKNSVELVLLDLGLPDAQNFVGLTSICTLYPSIPVVVLTGAEDAQLGLDALQHGAQDYLFKSHIDSHSLYRAIRYSSERAAFERAKQQSELHFSAAFDSAASGMAILDLDKQFLRVNRALCDLLGHPEEALLGMNILDFTDPDMESRFIRDLDLICKGSIEYQLDEYFMVAAYDVRIYVLLSASLIKDSDKKASHLIIHFVDLTERKEAEMKLMQSQKLEAVGQLTGGIAHDFNNLLAIIMGNLEMLDLSRGLSDEDRGRVKTALNATTRGADITNRLLSFSRQQPLAPKLVDINKVIEDLKELLSVSLGETVELEIKEGTGVWQVLIDSSQLESTLLNLVVNSRDAMPHGGKVTIGTSNTTLAENEIDSDSPAGDYVMLSVNDTGEGISQKVIDKVLQPFFTTKEVGKGSGLGLSMAFGFLKQSGGLIKIESQEGVGTTVRLYFPRQASGIVGLPEKAAPETKTVEAPNDSQTILVVEDDPNVREIVVKQLNSLGYETLEAADALLGLETIKSSGEGINLIFSDIKLPGGMSGVDLAEELRRIRPEIPILLTSGFADEFIQMKDKTEPPPILRKPYSRDQLSQKIRSILDLDKGG